MCLEWNARHTAEKKRKVIRNGNKKEINANIKHTIQTQIGSIITIKKRENIPKIFFIHFPCICIMPNTHQRDTGDKKNFPLQKFLK